MSRCVGIDHLESQPYILDVDLDPFDSRKAIEPAAPETVYRPIRNAMAITVATEAECVDGLKFDDEPIDAEMLLDRLMTHIHEALNPRIQPAFGFASIKLSRQFLDSSANAATINERPIHDQ